MIILHQTPNTKSLKQMAPKYDSIRTPDGMRWTISYHASKRMDLYSIPYEVVVDLIYNGASVYAKTAKNVYKIFNKNYEMVANVENGRIITIYKR